MTVAIGLLVLLFLLFFGMPVAFALGVAGMVGLFLVGGADMVIGILRTTPLSTTSSYELVTIPMFMLMVSRQRSGLAITATPACMFVTTTV